MCERARACVWVGAHWFVDLVSSIYNFLNLIAIYFQCLSIYFIGFSHTYFVGTLSTSSESFSYKWIEFLVINVSCCPTYNNGVVTYNNDQLNLNKLSENNPEVRQRSNEMTVKQQKNKKIK